MRANSLNLRTDTELFEAILLLGKLLGFSRSVATVFALLYSGDTPLSVEELVEHSGLSKSAVSLALRDLLQMGAIQEKMLLGERCRYYAGMPDMALVAIEIVMAKLQYPLSELHDRVGDLSGSHGRITQVRNLLSMIDGALHDIQQAET